MKVQMQDKCAQVLNKVKQRVKNEEKSDDSELKKLTFSLMAVEKKKPFNKKNFNEVVERKLEYSKYQSISDEVCFNWLKEKAENQENLCYKTIFFKDELFSAQEGASQEFNVPSHPRSRVYVETSK